MNKREIYSIAFNKSVNERGEIRMYVYTLDQVSLNGMRTPRHIVIKEEKVYVEFTDGTRHIIPLANDVEIFDRIIIPKTNKDDTK